MRVCLINPPRIHPKVWGKPAVYQPIEIAYMAAVLEHQHNVNIIDAPTEGWQNLELDEKYVRVGLSKKEIDKRIKRLSPDLVGINIPFSGWSESAFEVASIVKSVDKDIITVLHGLHPSARSVQCISHSNIDFIVIGEEEHTIRELVNILEQGKTKDLKEVEGICFKKNGKPIVTRARAKIQDLDALPFPARHLLPMDIYFDAVKEEPLRGVINKHWASMVTSRGCPYECIFCSNHILMGKKWRSRSPENVVDEIEQLIQTYSIKQIDFVENNMSLDKKRMENICDLIIQRGLDINWYTPDGLRADTLDECLLRKMKASGCKKIRIAPESGVQRVVNQIIKKDQKLENVEKAVVLAKKVGIKVGIFFILGLIGETKEDMEETIRYAYKLRELGADIFHFSVAIPLYGTELYEQAKHGGFLTKLFSDKALAGIEPLIETSEFSVEDIQELCVRANKVNRTITWDKIERAIHQPKKAVNVLRLLLTKSFLDDKIVSSNPNKIQS